MTATKYSSPLIKKLMEERDPEQTKDVRIKMLKDALLATDKQNEKLIHLLKELESTTASKAKIQNEIRLFLHERQL